MLVKKLIAPATLLAIILLTSCSPRIVGTWNVLRFETSQAGQNGIALRNIGTIQFNKNGTGEKQINYSALGVNYDDKNPFKWTWNEGKYVSIVGKDSEFSKTWIIMTNKKKYQKWKSTDGTNKIQVIELNK